MISSPPGLKTMPASPISSSGSRTLSNAPVLEAVLDIRVVPRDDATVEDLQALDEVFRHDYPVREELRLASFQLNVVGKEARAETTSAKRMGFKYTAKDKKDRVQTSIDGFTQNVLAPYANFESLVGKAKAGWEAYVAAARPRSITRIAVRYINELRLPVSEPLESNLLTFPIIPEGVPQTVGDFALRVTIHNPPIGAFAIVNQVSQAAVDERGLQVFLDIDAIMQRQIDIDDSALWAKFEQLRAFKNDIFFRFLSESLLEKYR